MKSGDVILSFAKGSKRSRIVTMGLFDRVRLSQDDRPVGTTRLSFIATLS